MYTREPYFHIINDEIILKGKTIAKIIEPNTYFMNVLNILNTLCPVDALTEEEQEAILSSLEDNLYKMRGC